MSELMSSAVLRRGLQKDGNCRGKKDKQYIALACKLSTSATAMAGIKPRVMPSSLGMALQGKYILKGPVAFSACQ